jgi:hypothetical protein
MDASGAIEALRAAAALFGGIGAGVGAFLIARLISYLRERRRLLFVQAVLTVIPHEPILAIDGPRGRIEFRPDPAREPSRPIVEPEPDELEHRRPA